MGEAPEIHRAEISGIPVFWAEGTSRYGGELVFNVGSASETLPTHGLSHLVEHLAFGPTGRAPDIGSGWTDDTRTVFWAEGTPEEVAEFLQLVAAGLSSLPLERVEAERRVLQTEAASRGLGFDAYHRWLRFGARGHGLRFYEEFGLRTASPELVASWARERFTAENAALFFTGPPAPDLVLDLPAGRRHPPVRPEPIAGLSLPTVYAAGRDVSLSTMHPPSLELYIAYDVLVPRLLTRLRKELGITYDIYVAAGQLSGELMHHTICADCHAEAVKEARDEMLDVVRDLAGRGPTADELRKSTDELRTWLADPAAIRARLFRRAEAELLGSKHDDYLEPVREVSPTEVADAFSSAIASGLLIVPASLAAAADGFHEYPTSSGEPVVGATYRAAGLLNAAGQFNLLVDPREDCVIVTGAGVTVYWAGTPVTVRFDDCEAMLRASDGRRVLISRDGWYLRLDPARWRKGKEAIRLVDERVPTDRLVPMEEDDF